MPCVARVGLELFKIRDYRMLHGRSHAFFLLLAISISTPAQGASSEMAPKPDNSIRLTLQSQAIPIFSGQGNLNVIMVSDPFCPFCRRSMRYLLRRQNEIATLSIVLHPLSFHPGADATCWILNHIFDHHPDKIAEAVSFAHGGLKNPPTNNPRNAREYVVNAFIDKFHWLVTDPDMSFLDYLRRKYAKKVTHTSQTITALGTKNIPLVIIDGTIILGYKPERFASYFIK